MSTGTSTVKVIQAKVKPGARVSALEEQGPGVWLAQLKSPPIDGKANEALVKFLAKHYNVNKSRVEVIKGHKSRNKVVKIKL